MLVGAYNGLELGLVSAAPTLASPPRPPTIDWYSLPGFRTHWDARGGIEAGGGDGSGNGVNTWYASHDVIGSYWQQHNSGGLQPRYVSDARGGYVKFDGGQWFDSVNVANAFSESDPFTVVFYRENADPASVNFMITTLRFGSQNSTLWLYNDGVNDAAYRSVGGSQYTSFASSHVSAPCVTMLTYDGSFTTIDVYYKSERQTATNDAHGTIGRMDYCWMGSQYGTGTYAKMWVRDVSVFGTNLPESARGDIAAKLHAIWETPG